MNVAWVYILESLRSGKYYIGSTTNLADRIKHHKSGHTPSTKRFGEIQLVFYQEFPLKTARLLEMRLKRMKRKDYLRKIVADGVIRKT